MLGCQAGARRVHPHLWNRLSADACCLACSARQERRYKRAYRAAVELESDLVYVSTANEALASVPYLIALDHSTRHPPHYPAQSCRRRRAQTREQIPFRRVHTVCASCAAVSGATGDGAG